MNNENLTLYEGVRANSATQQGIHMPENVAAQGLGQAYANIGKPLDTLSEQFVKSEDFAGKMKAEGDMNTILMTANTEMVRRFNLPDGDDDSFYNADGSVRQGKIKDFMNGYMRSLDELHKLPVLPESQEEIQRRAMHYGQGVASQLVNQAVQEQKKKTLEAMKYNIDTANEIGDFQSVENIANAAQEKGVISKAQRDFIVTSARKKAVENRLATLTEDDPYVAFDYLNGEASRYLTPIEKLRYSDALRARAKQREVQKMDEFFAGDIPESIRAEIKAEGKEKKEGPEFWGTHSGEEIAWLYAAKNGQAAEVLPAVRGHAMEEAMSLSPQLLDDPAATEKARADFESRYSYFGMEKSDINRIWNDGMKNLSRVKTGGINPKVRLDAAKSGGQLFNREAFDAWRNSWKKDEDGELTYEEFEKDGYARIRWGAAAGVSDTDTKEKAYAKIEKLKQVNMQAEMAGRIQERYSAWLDTKEGEAATPLEQLEKLNAIASAEVGHKVSVGGAESIQGLRTKALDTQWEAYRAFQLNNPRVYREERTEPTATWQKVDVGFDAEQKDLPRGILVPEAMLQGKKKEDVVYDMVFDNKHYLRLRVVGTTNGGAPVMTYATAREGGRMLNKVYTVLGKLREGDASVLLDEVENPVGNVKYTNGNYVTGDWAGTLNTQQVPQGLQPYINDFVDAGNQYGVNPAFLIAISMNETADGTSYAFRNKNNAMGISDESGPIRMSSVRASIFKMAKELGTRSHYRGRTLQEIGSVYAPVGAANDPRGLNGGWAKGVAAKLKKLNS